MSELRAAWEATRPVRPSLVPGVSMAAFRSRDVGPVDVRAVPHPAVTLHLEFGAGPVVVDNGRRQRGSGFGSRSWRPTRV